MPQDHLMQLFIQFGLAAVLGFLIGLERELREKDTITGIRDFVLFSLVGAISSYAALQYEATGLILAGFIGVFAMLAFAYQNQSKRDYDPGITTELAAVMTFFTGVIIMQGAIVLAIALAILTVGVLFTKETIGRFRARMQLHEMRAVLLFMTITFVVLPILPNQPLDDFLTLPSGEVVAVDQDLGRVEISVGAGRRIDEGTQVFVYSTEWLRIGRVEIDTVDARDASGRYLGDNLAAVRVGSEIRSGLGVEFLEVMASAIRPYFLWLIVVLVSFVSFAGYVLIKVIGSGAGIGLTGLIGGLVSSTVTTLSFARRSIEAPRGNDLFAVAIILASSIMFPRLLLEIAVVNPTLVQNIVLPLTVMGVTGALMAALMFLRARQQSVATAPVEFSNPFSLKSAMTFAVVFAGILMFTRLATHYLGDAWLPLVAIVSGLTDADAIAFSVSSLHAAGLIHIDWASFNLVLGAISNTFMKLFLVFGLGDRALFKKLLLPFMVIGLVGLTTTVFYYDLSGSLLS